MYDVLGLDRNASEADIKKAHRKLVREHHPDKGGDAEKFKKVQEAYEVLSDPQKRANFDQFGSAEGNPMGFPPGAGGFPPDLFAQMFGGFPGAHNRGGPVRRPDHNHEIRISMEESYRGASKNLKLTLTKPCMNCRKKCQQCGGRGTVHMQMGPMAFQQPCPSCGGQGHARVGCAECSQKGHKLENLNLELKIVPGSETGDVITCHGLGEQAQGPKEEPGDLKFHIKVQDHPEFMRQGIDMVWTTRIAFADSVLGKEIRIPHFDGDIMVNTSEWGVLDPREDYVIANKGFQVGHNKGRLRVSFNIIYPPANVRFNLSKIEAQ